jgi:L-lactate dehydrogenase complex protein LldG
MTDIPLLNQNNGLSLFHTFQKEIESLNGHAYIAANTADVAHRITEIAHGSNSRRVAKQKLHLPNEKLITTELERAGVEVTEINGPDVSVNTLSNTDLAITTADLFVAWTGSVVIATNYDAERLISCLPRVHVAVGAIKNLTYAPRDATAFIRKQLNKSTACTISFISGPSRTSDIEMKPTFGVHGPHEVHAILLQAE